MMKKFLSIVLLFLFSCNWALAGTREVLYKTALDNKSLSSQIKVFFDKNQYQVDIPLGTDIKTNFYVKNPSASSLEYVIISVAPNASGSYIYYLSNEKSLDLENILNQSLKKSKIKLTKVRNKELLASFTEDALFAKKNFDAKSSSTPQKTTYDFSDEAQQQYDAQKETKPVAPVSNSSSTKQQKSFVQTATTPVSPPASNYVAPTSNSGIKVLKGCIINVPSGTSFGASLQSTVDSASLVKDDRITATLGSDFVYKGLLVAPSGSVLYGKATKVSHPTLAGGNGDMELVFNQILTPNGTKIDISSEPISLRGEANRALNISKGILKGAGVGLLAALIYSTATAGSSSSASGSSSSNKSSGILKAAAIGAACGGIVNKGENVKLKPGTPLQIKLNKPLNTSPYN